MRSDASITLKIERLCSVGRETSVAVYRILRRIHLIEERGSGFVDYLLLLAELEQLEEVDQYRLRPDECICAALIRINRIDSRREVVLEDIGNAKTIVVKRDDPSSEAGC